MPDLRRREFITLLGGAAAAWPLAASAQQPTKLRIIGYLGSSTALAQSQWVAAFLQRLRQLGWVEGRTIAMEYRWAEGRNDRFGEIAAEFVRLKVDVIVTSGTVPTLAAKRTTSDVPIIFAVASDPVGNALVASLARPGGNVTGLSIQQTDLAAKKLTLLRDTVPDLRRLAIMANIGSPAGVLEMGEVQATARTLGIEVSPLGLRRSEDIAPCLRGGQRSSGGPLYLRRRADNQQPNPNHQLSAGRTIGDDVSFSRARRRRWSDGLWTEFSAPIRAGS